MSLHEAEIKLPSPLSHFSQTVAVATNEEGWFFRSACLLGGCRAPFTSSSVAIANGTVSQYLCSNVSDINLDLSPHGGHYEIEERLSMPRKRYRHASVAINGQVWVIGGRDENDKIVNEIDIYDEIRDQWFTLGEGLDSVRISDDPNYKYGVSDHVAFAYGEVFFIAGGFDRNYNSVGYTVAIEAAKSIERNHLVHAIRSPLHVPRAALGVTEIGDLTMVAGGFTSEDGYCEALTSSEIYDLRKDSWVRMNSTLNQGRANPSLVYLNHKVFAFGGERRGEFDPISGDCKNDLSLNGADETLQRIGITRTLPNRLSVPVESAEVMITEEDIYTSQWQQFKRKVGNGTLYASTTATDPSASSYIFFLGGVNNHFTKDKLALDKNCPGCFEVSDRIFLFDTDKESEGLISKLDSTGSQLPDAVLAECIAVVAAVLGAIATILIIMARKAKNRAKVTARKAKKKIQDNVDLGDGRLSFRQLDIGTGGGRLNWRGESTLV